MATKDLSRTVLEGGRRTHNKYERRHSHNEDRAYVRTELTHVKQYEDGADDADTGIKHRKKVYKGFTDKLEPAWRWLRSRVGMRWDTVYSELRAKFDTRTLAGMHVVEQHMLREVWGYGWAHRYAWRIDRPPTMFYVDKDGKLRESTFRWRNRSADKPTYTLEQIEKFLNGRRLRAIGAAVFWCIPLKQIWAPCPDRWCRHVRHRIVDVPLRLPKDDPERARILTKALGTMRRERQCIYSASYRQGHRLNKVEMEWWNKLRPNEIEKFLEQHGA